MSLLLNLTLVMLVELSCDPARQTEFLDVLSNNLEASRTAEGNLQFDIIVDPERPDKIFFIEQWESPQHQQRYMQWRVENAGLEILAEYLVAPPVITSYQKVAD